MTVRILSGAFILSLAAAIAFMHSTALSGFLYWRYRWLDVPMHFVGGFLVASVVLWLIAFVPFRGMSLHRFGAVVVTAFAVGVAWEVFEYATGLTRGEAGYWLDTSHDLAMDLVGAVSSWFVFPRYDE